MKKVLLAPLAVAIVALSCQASEVIPTQEGCVAEYRKRIDGFTYVARLYDQSSTSITMSKIAADEQSERDLGCATFDILYGRNGYNRPASVVISFGTMSFNAENQQEHDLVEQFAREVVNKHKCYFKPPMFAQAPW